MTSADQANGAEPEHFDVLVIGAGISGIGAGYRLQTQCPKKTYAILEAREAVGGTWDLFRYPGIRSDSDMFTLGFPWRPWDGQQAIADGASIRRYIEESARASGIDRKIRFGHRVERASWSSASARWTVEVRRSEPQKSNGANGANGARAELQVFTCSFLFMGTGYYDYSGGYTPAFPGLDRYQGRLVHPQKWTDDIVHAGKRVVVIGSGATAVGLVPALAREAAHVTMLQRSPTYMMSFPGVDAMSRFLDARLPRNVSDRIMRTRNVMLGKAIYGLCRRYPERAKKILIGLVKKQIRRSEADGREFDIETHFTPRYNPWDQRLCLIRDGDLFQRINEGKVDIVTDQIETFTERGIRVKSGQEIEADIVVTATGLNVVLLANIPLIVDGELVDLTKTTMYKGTMLSGVPNLALSLGYVNASWTLRADLICQYVCRVLNEMDRRGYRSVTPRRGEGEDADLSDDSVLPLSSGYVERVKDRLPRQGTKRPWKNVQAYVGDLIAFRYAKVDDGVLRTQR
jgi:monooxygenase